MGVALSIDDFGTGYTSLASIKRLPVSEIKIDKSFVANMLSDANDAMIVHSIIELGHNLGLKVVAEGVETQEAFDALATFDCDEAQGYFISRPLACEPLKAGSRRRRGKSSQWPSRSRARPTRPRAWAPTRSISAASPTPRVLKRVPTSPAATYAFLYLRDEAVHMHAAGVAFQPVGGDAVLDLGQALGSGPGVVEHGLRDAPGFGCGDAGTVTIVPD